ncbi:MAG: DUF3301 domain-containing protein [Gammaproteobacteria bacterium]|nr:DUF3301 domain-containing protein [Gammaproteobacteria bacterium]
MDGFFVILLLGAIAWFWYGAVQAKEIAVTAAKLRCDSRGLLLLDQTVSLHKIRLRRDQGGQMRFEREFHFEFSVDGDERYEGSITLHANRVTNSSIDYPKRSL